VIKRLAARGARPALFGLLALAFLLNLLNLVAAGYEWRAEHSLDALPDEAARRASAIAASLTPWSAPRNALRGWIAADAAELEPAAAAYARALRAAPADALLWTEYAQALSRNRVFDGRLTWATLRALALAPSSPAVRQSVSRMGLHYWRRGEPQLQELWRQSFRWELDHNRTSFLRTVEDGGYRRTFCAMHAEPLGEAAYCGGRG
jgi:hypothetical protein